MVNGAFESGLTSNGMFLLVGITDDHKRVKSSETGNTSEPPDSFLKPLTADHQGRLSEISNLWINDFGHEIFQQRKKS